MTKFLFKILFVSVILVFGGSCSFSFSDLALAQERSIVSSTFPVYLFTKNIIKGREGISLELLTETVPGCPHDYTPAMTELERLSRADILVINGLGLETFLPQALRVAKADLQVLDASASLGGGDAKEAVVVLNKDKVKELGRGPNPPNPHTFASAGTAADMVRNISDGLTQVDPGGAMVYRRNAGRLVRELDALASAFKDAGKTLGQPKVMVSHGIFHYLALEMGLEVVASLEEVDGARPSAAGMTALIRQAKEKKVRAILADPEGDVNLAQTVGAEANIPVIVVDLVASGPKDAPLDYYQKVMLTDLEVLMKALSPPVVVAE